jgi:transcriptional regulator with XRE-family HTH domain
MPSVMPIRFPNGERLAELRERKKMTQEELAAAIGVGANTVSRWERGLCEPQGPAKRWLKANWPEVYASSSADDTAEHATVDHADSLTGS